MFTSEKYDKLYRLMHENKLDAIMIAPSGDLEYMIGFNPGGCERFQALIVTSGKKHFYICNQLYLEYMKRCFTSNTPFFVWKDGVDWVGLLQTAFEQFSLQESHIAVNNNIRAIDLLDMKNLFKGTFFNGHDMLEEFRSIKSENDLDKMRTAARVADEVMDELTRFIRPGLTERDIKNQIVELFSQKGADGVSFTPIVASGSNTSKGRYCEDDRTIEKKDVIILDLGCKFQGYCSDISRTFFVGGVTEKENKIYRIVSEAHDAAIDYVKEGVTCGDVDKKARDVIEEAGYGDCFLNRTGHGIGFDVHEAPYIKRGSEQMLQRGMAFSIEPGIYIPGGVGVRIEDIVVVNHQGETEVLNKFSRDIIVIPSE